MFNLNEINFGNDVVITNERHKNLISKDVLENTDDYCVGYSYDDDYFYFDYYTGTYNKLLWYAFDSRTGKCNLQNQEYSHSYQINRDDLTSKKIVK